MKKNYFNLRKKKNTGLLKLYLLKLSLIFICLSIFSIESYAQQINISGKVIDTNGESIIGASIQIVGQTAGTFTDIDGNFTLSVPANGQIKVSYLGFVTQTININNHTSIIVKLEENTANLDEVVVIGYGTVKRRDLTGSVASVKSDEITIAPTTNVMEALQGRVSGMDIVKSSGQVGRGVDVVLRGSRTIYGSNTPLFIIDGIIGSYDQINPSDIESVDVLKDPSTTAIYGSAGANGVVIITTKQGKAGKATVNFNAYLGFSGTPKFPHGMKGQEWADYRNEAYKYLNGQYPSDMSAILTDADKYEAYQQNKWIDWVDEAMGNTAVNQKYNVSVTAGNEKTHVFASLSYDREEGLLKNENQDRYAARLNIDQRIFPWAKVGFISNLTYTIRNRGVKNTFTKAISAFPLGTPYDENGDIVHEYAPKEYSPLSDFIKNQFVDNNRYTYLNTNAYIELTPLGGLTFKSVVSATLGDGRLGQYWGNQCNANRPSYAGSPHAEVTNSNTYGYMWDNILTYSKTLLEDHNFGITVLSSWQKDQNESNKAASSGQFLDSWSFYRLLAGTSARVESDYAQKQKMSYAARFNYAYKGKYLLTVSTRWDGVSWFSEGHKWDAFPAGALAWRLSDESFMKSTKNWIDNLKMRVSYGVTGNSGGMDAYSTTTKAYAYSSAGITIDGKIVPFTQYTGTYGSKNLGWEKSYTWNVGMDFSIINNRIDASIDWFKTDTKDLLFKRKMPITSGATGWGAPLDRWENIAETSNRGIEVKINSHNIQNKDFTWNTSLTLTWNKEKIESLPNGDLLGENLFIGQPIKSHYSYKYAGIWGTDTPADVLAAYGVKPGWVKIQTVPRTTMVNGIEVSDEGVHKYSEKDRQILGHANPDFIAGLNNSITYKWFDLNVFVMARYGQTIQSSLLGWYNAKAGDSSNQISGVDYWTESNQGAYYPVPGSGDEQASVMPSLQYRDGSFIKLKNITLGYTLPKKISKIALMDQCRFYFTAYNPFIIVKDKQLRDTDPETNGSDAFPLYKQFVFGVNLTF